MAVHTSGSLEPKEYWQQVCSLANDLLVELPLKDWDVTVRPQASEPHQADQRDADGPDAARWGYEADHGEKKLTVVVPPDCHDPDDGEPEDLATYIVFDLLYGKVCRGGEELPSA